MRYIIHEQLPWLEVRLFLKPEDVRKAVLIGQPSVAVVISDHAHDGCYVFDPIVEAELSDCAAYGLHVLLAREGGFDDHRNRIAPF